MSTLPLHLARKEALPSQNILPQILEAHGAENLICFPTTSSSVSSHLGASFSHSWFLHFSASSLLGFALPSLSFPLFLLVLLYAPLCIKISPGSLLCTGAAKARHVSACAMVMGKGGRREVGCPSPTLCKSVNLSRIVLVSYHCISHFWK